MTRTLSFEATHQLPAKVFTDKREYLKTVIEGIPGTVVKQFVKEAPEHRRVVVRALGATSSNLSRLYARKSLNMQQTEEMLDILRIQTEAIAAFEDEGMAKEWLNTSIPALNGEKPLDLLDTFIGRSIVSDALNKIKWGEFC
jgi:putative toxin-antitoxin system antitoxin component (TIGR02293 family)